MSFEADITAEAAKKRTFRILSCIVAITLVVGIFIGWLFF
jgi:hypothetical protein